MSNFDFTKTLLNANKQYIDMKVSDGTTHIHSWNDLEDRPFYTADPTENVLAELTIPSGEYQAYVPTSNTLTAGEMYTVVFDGVTYSDVECVELNVEGISIHVIGSIDGSYSDYPFGFSIMDGAAAAMTGDTSSEHSIKVIGYTQEIIELNEKYIPYVAGRNVSGTIYTIDDVEVTAMGGAEVFNNYINNKATGHMSHAEGYYTIASATSSHAEGSYTTTTGDASHAEGSYSTASGHCSHAEGQKTVASGWASHAEGLEATASGDYSHSEGYFTTASGAKSHAEGEETTASGLCAHAEGRHSTASGDYSHAEGSHSTASGDYSHAEGITTASGENSHSEGYFTTASGAKSHAEGWETIASGETQHVQGRFNIEDANGVYAHIVGNGDVTDDDIVRSNAHTLDWDGNAWYQGSVEATAIILSSPNGTRFQITVGDDGVLTATEITVE